MKKFLFAIVLMLGVSLFGQNKNNLSYLKITQDKCTIKKGKSILLKEVLSDSRCPEGVSCIWAGEIKVVVSVYQDKKFIKDEILTIAGDRSQENLDWFAENLPSDKKNIKGITVFPSPKEGVTIKSKDYYIQIAYIK